MLMNRAFKGKRRAVWGSRAVLSKGKTEAGMGDTLQMDAVLEYSSGWICAGLRHGEKTLVDHLHFTIHAGESLALIGETGSGKTMTALSIMGLLPGNVTMRDGRILFFGQDLTKVKKMSAILGREIVYIPQNGLEFLNPARKVRHHLYDSLKRMGVKKSGLEAAALEKLRLSGFEKPMEVMDKFPFQLSGGMAQRVTIAISACSDAKLMIADEPTNGLDEDAKKDFMDLLHTVFPQAAKLVITHDIGIAKLCDRAMVLCGGKAMETGPAQDVLSSPRHPYTKALISALVENGMEQTPILRTSPGGCPFYARCAAAEKECEKGITHRTDQNREWWCSGKCS